MAIKDIESYQDLLYELQTYRDEAGVGYPQIANLLPAKEQVCAIDLDSRTIKTPGYLSVQYDHNAEIVYFKVNRYMDNMDLANTVCIIEYLNAPHTEGKAVVQDPGVYWVPFYDVSHYDVEIDKNGEEIVTPVMYIPWAIGGLATAYAGTITFTVRFYVLDENKNFLYNMSTRPTKADILHGLDLTNDEALSAFYLESSIVQQIYNDLTTVERNATTYWEDAYR